MSFGEPSVNWASPIWAGSPRRQAESSSLSYGLVVHLPLLSTSPRGDAVTFGYDAQTGLGEDLHLADSTHLQAHPLGGLPPVKLLEQKLTSAFLCFCCVARPGRAGEPSKSSMARTLFSVCHHAVLHLPRSDRCLPFLRAVYATAGAW